MRHIKTFEGLSQGEEGYTLVLDLMMPPDKSVVGMVKNFISKDDPSLTTVYLKNFHIDDRGILFGGKVSEKNGRLKGTLTINKSIRNPIKDLLPLDGKEVTLHFFRRPQAQTYYEIADGEVIMNSGVLLVWGRVKLPLYLLRARKANTWTYVP